MPNHLRHAAALITACAALLPALATAQENWPTKPITLIVPFTPGGSSDITARSVSQGLLERLGQTVVIENRSGANSAIGAQALARSAPDGYTMMVGSIGTFAINEALYRKAPSYNPSRDFTFLTQAVRNPNLLIVPPDFPANSVAELIAYAKAHPGELSYASSGTGSSDHLSANLFRLQTGTTGVDVPYKGGSAAVVDLMGGQVNASFQNLGAVQTYALTGKLKALAVTGAERVPELPDVPTLKELGIDMVVYSWQGFAVPKGTPAPVVEKLSGALRETLAEPKVRATLNGLGFEVVANTPEEFSAFQQAEVRRWTEVIDQAGIEVL